jgi:hypothetical protein
MKPFWQSLKQHPFSTIGFIFYLLIYSLELRASLSHHAALSSVDSGEKVAWGEGVMWGYMLVSMIAFIFIILNMINGSYKNGNSVYYLWLSGLIALPLVLLWNI